MATRSAEKKLVDSLKTVPLFHQTTKKQRQTLAKLGKIVTWKAGSVPIKQGSKGAAFFLILDGMVDVVADGHSVARLSEGDFVGEIALIEDTPRNADVKPMVDTTVFAFGRPGLAAALNTEPSMGIALLKAMASRRNATM
ncbi:MAG: cyclic nucleotide-binding domain-containing protein [Acidimicrobiales bacterium]